MCKFCRECLIKRKKYVDNTNKCQKHGVNIAKCLGCKLEKDIKEGKEVKPMKTKTKEIKIDENGNVTVIYFR